MTIDPQIEKNSPAYVSRTDNLKVYQTITIVCFILAGLIALSTLWFSYNYTFNTINKIQTIGILRLDLQIKPIDFNMYESVLQKRQSKISTSSLGLVTNPFVTVATSTKKR